MGPKVDRSRVLYIITALGVIALPLLSILFGVGSLLGRNFLDFVPHISDEIYYWHQAATFREAGFNGGYYTVNEIPAPISFIHYYAWGPASPIVFGSIGKLLGWKFNSIPILNLVFLSLAIAWFIKTVKPGFAQLGLMAAVLISSWPLQLYLPTGLLVVTFMACGIIMAAVFHRIIADPKQISRFQLAGFFTAIVLMTLFQASWALLFLPFLVIIRERLRLSIPQGVLAAALLIASGFLIYNQASAPYPNFANQWLGSLHQSLYGGLRSLAHHVKDNLFNFFDLSHPPLWLLLRGQMLVLMFSAGFNWIRHRRQYDTVNESIVVLLSCSLLVAMAILLYDIYSWRDYRLFAPITLMATLLLLARRRYRVVVLLIGLNLIFLPNFLGEYRKTLEGAFSTDRTSIERFSERITTVIQYDRNKDAWENTLLVPLRAVENNLLLGVPAGIGISWFDDPEKLTDIKSRYLLLDEGSYEVLKDRTCLEFELATDLGGLYTNHGQHCEK